MKYYHIYNRGAHKALVFHDHFDYQRMLNLFYISNSENSFVMRNFRGKNIYDIERSKALVKIVAYCLMPNHFHIALEIDEQSKDAEADQTQHKSDLCITKFMRKVMTGYSNYYNLKYKHSGTVWQGAYKKKVSPDYLYLETVITYIHLNPYTTSEEVENFSLKKEFTEQAWAFSKQYKYSSLYDYCVENRPESKIITKIEGVRTSAEV